MARVLVVDDSQTETQKIRNMLSRHGHEVLEAATGDDGVSMARELQPDVVLMDIVMPGTNGFQATRQIKRDKSTGHIPVIIVTTKDQETDRIWGKRQGAMAFLVKPVEEKTLINTINEALASG